MSEENKSRLEGAIEQLRNHQTQLDADGIMVGVSREALDMALAALSAPKAEAVCEDCGRHIHTKNHPASGWLTACGKRLTRLEECGNEPRCTADEFGEPTRPTSPVPALTDEAVERAAWMTIDSAPRDGSSFLASQDEWVYRCQWFEEESDEGASREGWFDLENLSFENPTHWMPLPKSHALLAAFPSKGG
ncbi:hypothetical protein JYP49_14090 [Nitratireductor aquimarinus]|uniref:hypothetical protein n=1 Tax=Nitratireductor TaxID=245876 RepID=UPI0019D390C3|nr:MULTISPECIES: hypothetical protein [Nitratireductor]MBN7777727.1 hypothetical protein [Nitratireductor pacificus]MBN7781721.1 hypothetical protein [Nitratireductor pacificus]MBN7790527.1 hypothetical protein [Nitratireductor aquimarinus]MBY6099937.1 hypothetical protein [Nitratireductor aquimarinus]MCA1260403.1 hypothetical protein [Nitratireductor aquimarinus]